MQHLLEALAVLGHVDHVGRGADDRHAVLLEVARELQRRLAAVLHDHAPRLLDVHDLEHVLERQRLEVQPVGGVVVGRDRLRVAVDHDGLEPVLAQRHRRVHAAVVELDALADAVRPAAQHHHLLAVGGLGLALVLVGRVHVRGARRELGGAGVDALEHRPHAQRVPPRAHLGLGGLEQVREPPVGEALALQLAQLVAGQIGERVLLEAQLEVDDLLDLGEEPRVDLRVPVQLLERHADAERVGDVPQPLARAGRRARRRSCPGRRSSG